MKITALLPMKGNSERVPNKNLRDLCGKPLFFYIAQILQDCDLVEQIILNTDSELIAEKAQAYFSKIKIHWRPKKIQGDLVPMNEIIAHDLANSDAEHFLQTHSTNPLLSPQTLTEAINKYFSVVGDKYNSLFSVTQLQTRLYWKDGKPINHNPAELLRTQDLPPVFEENSNLYLFNKDSFECAENNRLGTKPYMFVMDPIESMDIDEESDFVQVENVVRLKAARRSVVRDYEA